jgi:hypothetical protein
VLPTRQRCRRDGAGRHLAPRDDPGGRDLVTEVRAPGTLGNQFIIGANTDPETQPGYLRGPACGSSAPVTFASISFPSTHIVLVVTGTM